MIVGLAHLKESVKTPAQKFTEYYHVSCKGIKMDLYGNTKVIKIIIVVVKI